MPILQTAPFLYRVGVSSGEVISVKAPGTRSVLTASLRTAGAESWPSSRLPRFPVLAFLVWNVFVATFVPKMAAGCSPEVTLVSVDWATSPWSGQRGGSEKQIK